MVVSGTCATFGVWLSPQHITAHAQVDLAGICTLRARMNRRILLTIVALMACAAFVSAAKRDAVVTECVSFVDGGLFQRDGFSSLSRRDGVLGRCCECCLNNNCEEGYTCCGDNSRFCYCCLQNRHCNGTIPEPEEALNLKCVR